MTRLAVINYLAQKSARAHFFCNKSSILGVMTPHVLMCTLSDKKVSLTFNFLGIDRLDDEDAVG